MEIRRRPPNPKVKVAHLEYAIPHEEAEPRHILEEIVWAKDREVANARERVSLEQLRKQLEGLPACHDFVAALRASCACTSASALRPARASARANASCVRASSAGLKGTAVQLCSVAAASSRSGSARS